MNQNGNRLFNRLPIPLVFILLVFPVPVWCAGISGGKVVWWGDNSVFLPATQSTQSNGVMGNRHGDGQGRRFDRGEMDTSLGA